MKYLVSCLLLCIAICSAAQTVDADADAIKRVISTSYIDGIHNGGSTESIRQGFHPTFTMLRLMDNDVKPLPIEEWITTLEKRKKENPGAPVSKAEGRFLSVDVTGTAAVVKLDLYRDGKKTFTDYLVLYKFTEGWKIVSKTFYRHP